MHRIILIVHNLRSSHNVGSLLRTAEGIGVERVYLTGYTPYPLAPPGTPDDALRDGRLPHIAQKVDKQIAKTALGAEKMVAWQHCEDVDDVIDQLKSERFMVIALEQAGNATKLPDFKPPEKVAIIVGREVEGIEPAVLDQADYTVEIPMFGHKESFNVAQAAAMALYHCRFS